MMILFFTLPVYASSSDLYLNHLDFEAKINQDGSMDVTEKWQIKIEDTNTLYKTFKIDPDQYSSITNVKVVDITNGRKELLQKKDQWNYHMAKGDYFGGENPDDEFEIAWGVGLENKTATKVYEISYQVKDVIAKYSDYAELYWQFVGKNFEIDANKITGTILLPSHVDQKEEIKVWGHTEDLNGEIYATGTNQIEFQINQFRSGRYVEIRTLFPTQMISNTSRGENVPRWEQVIKEETAWANEANERRERKEKEKTIIAIGINGIAIILTIFSIRSILKARKKMKNYKKLVPTQEIIYFREIPREDATPAEALSILMQAMVGLDNSVFLGKIFSATILDLNLKKMIELEEKDKIITIKIVEENAEKLGNAKEEKAIFDFLKIATQKTDGKITTKELEKYIKKFPNKVLKLGKEIDSKTEEALYQKQLADAKGKAEKTKVTTYIVMLSIFFCFLVFGFILLTAFSMLAIGIIPLGLAIIVQSILYDRLANKINVLTQKGVDENNQWKGLKKYMEDFSMLDQKEVPEIVIWEKFMVYATVFGIADKVLKQLKVVYPNLNEEWSRDQDTYWYLMMNTNFSNSFSHAITNSMSSAYSSSTGGGGGFSGGGRRPDGGRWWRGRKIIHQPPRISTKERKERKWIKINYMN